MKYRLSCLTIDTFWEVLKIASIVIISALTTVVLTLLNVSLLSHPFIQTVLMSVTLQINIAHFWNQSFSHLLPFLFCFLSCFIFTNLWLFLKRDFVRFYLFFFFSNFNKITIFQILLYIFFHVFTLIIIFYRFYKIH